MFGAGVFVRGRVFDAVRNVGIAEIEPIFDIVVGSCGRRGRNVRGRRDIRAFRMISRRWACEKGSTTRLGW